MTSLRARVDRAEQSLNEIEAELNSDSYKPNEVKRRAIELSTELTSVSKYMDKIRQTPDFENATFICCVDIGSDPKGNVKIECGYASGNEKQMIKLCRGCRSYIVSKLPVLAERCKRIYSR